MDDNAFRTIMIIAGILAAVFLAIVFIGMQGRQPRRPISFAIPLTSSKIPGPL
jgi:hypothetical protein